VWIDLVGRMSVPDMFKRRSLNGPTWRVARTGVLCDCLCRSDRVMVRIACA
jgi:hypothetical protein